MATINASKLAHALRTKYGSERAGKRRVASILGLDENLFEVPGAAATSGNGDGDADLTKLRTDIEALLSEGNLSNRIHADLHAELLELLKRAAPSSVMAGDMTEEERERAFKKLLRDKGGLSDHEISEALDIASGGGRAKDTMPEPGLPSRGGQGGAVHRAKTQIGADARLRHKYPGIENIIVEAPPLAADASPIKLGPSSGGSGAIS